MGISLSYPLVNEPESYVDPDFDEGNCVSSSTVLDLYVSVYQRHNTAGTNMNIYHLPSIICGGRWGDTEED